jgi:Maltose acetyltransferase
VLDDIQLQAKKITARQFCAKYNVDDDVLKDDEMPLHELFMGLRTERERLLRTIIGSIGQGPVIEPPFNFQYGFNITMGDSVYANVKLVTLSTINALLREKIC